MSTIFLALAVAITLVTTRPWWERITIIMSAVPIAILVNVIRITVTGILYVVASHELAEAVFHDLAGWIMMPMAMGFLFVELTLLSHLFIEDDDHGPAWLVPCRWVWPAVAGDNGLTRRTDWLQGEVAMNIK